MHVRWYIIAGAIVLGLLIMTMKAKATVAGGSLTDSRIQALADAIGGIEGSPGGNLGIRQGKTATRDDLVTFLTGAFVNGTSSYYDASMSFRALAWTWVCGPQAWNGGDPKPELCDPRDNPETWASFVAGRLGVDVNSSVGEYLSGV